MNGLADPSIRFSPYNADPNTASDLDTDGDYGINWDAFGNCGAGSGMLAFVQKPAEILLVGACGDAHLNEGGNEYPPLEDLDLDWNSGLEAATRHNEMANWAVMDGHAKAVNRDFLCPTQGSGDCIAPWNWNM